MGANPHTNGGALLRDLRCPISTPRGDGDVAWCCRGQDTLVLGKFLRDVAKLNQDQRNSGFSVPMRRSRTFWAQF